jgi:hypothetical protein
MSEQGPTTATTSRYQYGVILRRDSALFAVLFFLCAAFATYVVLRIQVTYEIQRDLLLLKVDNVRHSSEVFGWQQACTTRLEALEQTVYGEVVPQQATAQAARDSPRVSRIEVAQQTFNKEMRARIERLERRLLER